MATRELHLELLLNTCVLDENGHCIGRIEEVRAARQGDSWVVTEYLVGSAALLERFSAWGIGLSVLRLLGGSKLPSGKRIPWDKLDLSEPAKPRLLCAVTELKPLEGQPEKS
jgi:hypothetical protein